MMYTPGQMQLQSVAMLNSSTGDRPSFQATVCRTFSARPYQVFMMPQGLLFLERRDKAAMAKDNANAVVVGAVLGGMLGACIASALTSNSDSQAESGLEHLREEDLFELARTRKRSFVARQDEILSLTIDAPGSFGRLFTNSSLAGWIKLRDRKLGKLTMEVHDQAALSVAVDSLPRRYGDRVVVNVEFDRERTMFRPRCR